MPPCEEGRFCVDTRVQRGPMAGYVAEAIDAEGDGTDYFPDDGDSPHEEAINALAAEGVVQGRESGEYRPGRRLNRAQMASYLARAWDLETVEADYFSDDEGSLHQDAINAVADAGISIGCGDGEFCVGEPVSRAQMASFLARALGDVNAGTASTR